MYNHLKMVQRQHKRVYNVSTLIVFSFYKVMQHVGTERESLEKPWNASNTTVWNIVDV